MFLAEAVADPSPETWNWIKGMMQALPVIASAVAAWATTGRPLLFATSTMRVISSSVNVGRASPFAPHR